MHISQDVLDFLDADQQARLLAGLAHNPVYWCPFCGGAGNARASEHAVIVYAARREGDEEDWDREAQMIAHRAHLHCAPGRRLRDIAELHTLTTERLARPFTPPRSSWWPIRAGTGEDLVPVPLLELANTTVDVTTGPDGRPVVTDRTYQDLQAADLAVLDPVPHGDPVGRRKAARLVLGSVVRATPF